MDAADDGKQALKVVIYDLILMVARCRSSMDMRRLCAYAHPGETKRAYVAMTAHAIRVIAKNA